MSSDLIFIIGRQRSGTTVFRDLLVRHGAMDCDEVFHGVLNHELRFFEYVKKQVLNKPELIHPQKYGGMFYSYINWLREKSNGRKLAIDMKYYALNLIPTIEDVNNERPFIIDFMKQNNASVVHIIRQNKLRVIVSEILAETTGRWSSERPEQLVTDKPRVSIDTKTIINLVNNLKTFDEKVYSLLVQTLDNFFSIKYREMFDEDNFFTPLILETASKILDITDIDPKPGNLKMNPEPLYKLIENFEEVENIFRASEHYWMLQDNG